MQDDAAPSRATTADDADGQSVRGGARSIVDADAPVRAPVPSPVPSPVDVDCHFFWIARTRAQRRAAGAEWEQARRAAWCIRDGSDRADEARYGRFVRELTSSNGGAGQGAAREGAASEGAAREGVAREEVAA